MTPVTTGNVVWGVTPLRLSCFLTGLHQPLELIVSVRAVLTAPNGGVFVFDDNGPHVLPGERREGPEFLDPLIREIGEEIGCTIVGLPRPPGFFELRNDGPRPERHPNPYHHVVFKATAGPVTRAPVDPNVHNGRFVTRDEALAMDLPWDERAFLEAT